MCLQKVKPVFNNHNQNKNEKPVNGKYKNKRTSEKGFFLIPVIYFVNNCFSKVECCAGSTAHLVEESQENVVILADENQVARKVVRVHHETLDVKLMLKQLSVALILLSNFNFKPIMVVL